MLLVLVLGVGASFAADSNQTDLQASDDTDIVVSISETDTVSSNDNDTVISVNENSGETLGATTGTFTQLQALINSNYGKTLTLTQDYAYDTAFGKTSGMTITSAITIDGQGKYSIDGKSLSRIFYVTGTNVILNNIKFYNGSYPQEGGAILWNGNYGILNNSYFEKNYVTAGQDGGAVSWHARYGTITYCTFIDNHCDVKSGDGGGLAYWGSDGYIAHCYFERNSGMPDVGGGAAHVWSGTNRTIFNCTFVNNTAHRFPGTTGGNGGALMLGNGADNYVIRCTFINNYAEYNGGALYSNPAAADSEIIGCIFINNTAGDNGGALLFDSVNFYIGECQFTNNTATNNGGAIGSNAKNSVIDGCTFENNNAQDGDNYYATSTENTIEIVDCQFDVLYISNAGTGDGLKSDNPTNWTYAHDKVMEGGKIILTSGTYTSLVNIIVSKTMTIVGDSSVTINANNNGRIFTIDADNVNITSIIFKNGKSTNGGAILWNGNYGVLSRCTFTSNSATNNGGALYVVGVSLTSTSNIFTSNSATNNGGAVYVEGNNAFIGSTTFQSNSAKYGGAIYNAGNNLVISEYTYTSNTASIQGPNLYSTGTYTQASKTYYPTLSITANDIIYGNNIVISGTLTDYYNGAIIDLLLNGNKVGTVTVNNGAFSYTLNRPSAGSYTVTLGGSDNEGNAYSYTYSPKTFYVYHEDSFYALQKLINSASSSLTLARNYNYYSAYDPKGIRINKVFILNGGNYIIDGKNLARLINVTSLDVTIENIKLVNAYYNGAGGAVYWEGTGGKLSGVTFTNNHAENYHNVYTTRSDLQIINSVFSDATQTITPSSTSVNYGNDFGVSASFDDGTNLNTNIIVLTGNGISLGTTTNGNSISYTYSKPLPNIYSLTFAGSDNNGNTYTYSSPTNVQVTVNRASTIYVAPTSKGLGLTEATATTWDNVANLLTNDGTVIFTADTYSNFYDKTISQSWTLKSVNGATIILDAGNKGRIFTVSANNVKIDGLTFKNGKATDSYGSAIHWTGTGGTLTNSVLTQNSGRPVTATTTLTMTNNQLKDQITLTKSNINWAGTETITGTFAHNAPSTVNILFNGTSQGSYSVASGKVTASYAFTNPSTRSVGSYVVTDLKNIYKEVL